MFIKIKIKFIKFMLSKSVFMVCYLLEGCKFKNVASVYKREVRKYSDCVFKICSEITLDNYFDN
jgi:hypothetical protein